jgi:hypothetical protein
MAALDYWKDRAKKFKKECIAGDEAALARVHAVCHAPAESMHTPGTVAHMTCLFVIARELGFKSWTEMQRASEAQLRALIAREKNNAK